MLTRIADMITSTIDHRERALICGRFGEMRAILHRHLEESPGIELLSVVVKRQEFSSTAWSTALIRATAKDRASSYFPCREALQVRTWPSLNISSISIADGTPRLKTQPPIVCRGSTRKMSAKELLTKRGGSCRLVQHWQKILAEFSSLCRRRSCI